MVVGQCVPCDKTVKTWFNKDFGLRSPENLPDGRPAGHTVCHPQKTDACSTCCRLEGDIKSLDRSLARHRQQSDLGTDERKAAMAAVEQEKKDLQLELKEHHDEAAEAKTHYNSAKARARAAYACATAIWNEMRPN